MSPETNAEPAPLEWPEVRAHLFESLMLDSEWVTDEQDGIWWQSFILPTHIYVSGRGQFGDDPNDTWTRVTAETSLCRADEEVGSAIASGLNSIYPYGTFFWADGEVTGMSSMAFNRLSRGELTLFHTAVLAQATVAQLAADRVASTAPEGDDSAWAYIQEVHPGNPSTPVRTQKDELLSIHWGERFGDSAIVYDTETAVLERWRSARLEYTELMTSSGYVQGFADESVIYFENGSGLAIGVGLRPDSTWSHRWGPGLDVSCLVSPAMTEPPDFRTVNDGNVELATTGLSALGNLTCYSTDEFSSLAVETFLPTEHLVHFGNSDADLAAGVFNAVGHIGNGARCVVIR